MGTGMNPFRLLAKSPYIIRASDGAVLARAFRAARTPEEVIAVLRYERDRSNLQVDCLPYLNGCFFSSWKDDFLKYRNYAHDLEVGS